MKGIMTRMLAGLGTRNRVVLELALLLVVPGAETILFQSVANAT